MILRTYDKHNGWSQPLSLNDKEMITTEELDLGYKTLKIFLPFTTNILKEEQQIEVENYRYIVKEIEIQRIDYYTVYCKPYFGNLISKHILDLNGINLSLEDCLKIVFEDTSWQYSIEQEVIGLRSVNFSNITALDALRELKSLFQFDYFFDTKEQILHIWKSRPSKSFNLAIDNSNLRFCQCQSNTYDLVTRLIPIGKNNVTVNSLNDGKLWVEDYSYTDEIIVGYWINQDIDSIDDLLAVAKEKIKSLSQPHISYQIKLVALSNLVGVGDKITISDKIRGINREGQVQKVVRYHRRYDKSYINVGDSLVSFDTIYKDFERAQKLINVATIKNLAELQSQQQE